MRLFIVVEYPRAPAIRVMALVAIRAKCFIVLIIHFMARVTGRAGIFKLLATVAFVTGSYRMLANKRELCDVMIEGNVCAPAGFSMAVVTLLTFLAFMYIIYLVAAQAVYLEFIFVYITLMAGITA